MNSSSVIDHTYIYSNGKNDDIFLMEVKQEKTMLNILHVFYGLNWVTCLKEMTKCYCFWFYMFYIDFLWM